MNRPNRDVTRDIPKRSLNAWEVINRHGPTAAGRNIAAFRERRFPGRIAASARSIDARTQANLRGLIRLFGRPSSEKGTFQFELVLLDTLAGAFFRAASGVDPSIPQRLLMSLAEEVMVLLEEFQLLPSGTHQHFFHLFNGFGQR